MCRISYYLYCYVYFCSHQALDVFQFVTIFFMSKLQFYFNCVVMVEECAVNAHWL